ncbi:glycosyltransferase family 4 protein [Candidatus Sumerlaeota bacterium]|nr:glycosyltransferase family 4 protein [Candidatus Sumerlaeota bacterium]
MTDATPSKPRICMWSYHWPPAFSGAGLQARRISLRLARRGWRVWALTTSPEVRRVTEIDDEGLRVVCVPQSRLRRFTPMALQTIWRLRRAMRRRQGDFDILHIHSAFLDAALGSSLAHRWGKRCIVKNTLPEVDMSVYGRGLWGKWQRRCFQTVGAFIGASPAAADELLRHGLPPKRIHRIPNGVDTDHFRPPEEGERRALRESLGLPPDARLLINHSSICARKGTDVLVEVMGLLRDRHPDLHLALVGPWERGGVPIENGHPDWFPDLRSRVAELGLTARIHFPGSQTNTDEWLRASDVFVFPTLNDLLPNSLLEAMATALPIAAFDVLCTQALLQHGESGLLTPPGDADALARSIEEILANPDLAEPMGEAARQHVSEAYSLDAVVTAYERLYLSLFES